MGVGREYGIGFWITCLMALVKELSWPLSVCYYWVWVAFVFCFSRVLRIHVFPSQKTKRQNALQTNGLGGSNDSYNIGVRVKSIHVGGVKLLKCNAI